MSTKELETKCRELAKELLEKATLSSRSLGHEGNEAKSIAACTLVYALIEQLHQEKACDSMCMSMQQEIQDLVSSYWHANQQIQFNKNAHKN